MKLLFSFSRLLFFCVLLVVVFGVFLFSSFYLGRESSFVYFFTLLLIFIVRMVLLNFRSRFLLLLVSWDLLGISRYFLVLFYNNWDRDVGSMNVALTNRLGDFFLFFAFVFFFCTSVSLHVFEFLFFISFLFIWLAGFTKRAQFPFSSWLPKAIRAPTPVRALVHRSTLVTAGLVLMMKFNFLVLGLWLSLVLGLVGLFTMFFSRGLALVEQDIKKVVALRTLSQMGFSCFVLRLSLSFFSLFHLLRHALFKSCLFIQVGYLIYRSLGQQDGRAYRGLSWGFTFLRFQLLLTLFCLCGMFFTRGLVSKDFVLEFFLFVSVKFFLVLLFLVSVFLTFFYSFRLWRGLFAGGFSFLYVCVSRGLQFVVSFLLSVFALSFVWFLSKNCVFVPLYGLYFSVWTPVLFVVFFFLVWFLFLKLFRLLLFWGFLVDFLARQFSFHLFNFRFFDLLLNRGLFSFFLLFKRAGVSVSGSFLSVNVLIFVLFFFLFVFLF